METASIVREAFGMPGQYRQVMVMLHGDHGEGLRDLRRANRSRNASGSMHLLEREKLVMVGKKAESNEHQTSSNRLHF